MGRSRVRSSTNAGGIRLANGRVFDSVCRYGRPIRLFKLSSVAGRRLLSRWESRGSGHYFSRSLADSRGRAATRGGLPYCAVFAARPV